jgi:hypothetical protein
MKKRTLVVAVALAIILMEALAISTSEAELNASQFIPSSGTVLPPDSATLSISSSANPAKTSTIVLISGQAPQNANNSVIMQYSKDQTTWLPLATLTADSEGKFGTEFAFPSSGQYTIKATVGNQVGSYAQLVVDRFVNPDGSEDSKTIQAAIDSLPTTGGVVYMRSGVYDLNGKSLVVTSGLTLVGEDIDKTIIRLFPTKHSDQASCFDAITSSSTITNLTLENFTLIQNFTPLNNHGGIVLRGTNENIIIRNIKVTDSSGAAISVHDYKNVLIENCQVDKTWTGIIVVQGTDAIIRNNVITNTAGDGIYPEVGSNNVTITDNYLENIGDTAIDIECKASLIHQNVVIENNTIKDGSLRITNAVNVQIIANEIGGKVSIDAGQGAPRNVSVTGNHIVSNLEFGIGFIGAYDCSAENHIIEMQPTTVNKTQVGIMTAIWGTGVIANNTVINAADYGVNFGGYRLGGSSTITIQQNTITNYGTYGIYDDNQLQAYVTLSANTIGSEKTTAQATVFMQCPDNHWIINL